MTVVAQAVRQQRAAEQLAQYQIRRVEIRTSAGVQVAFYVTNPRGTVYTVQLAGPGRHHACCNCPDYQRRCAGTHYGCKHVAMVQRHEFNGRLDAITAEKAEQSPAERMAAVEARLAARAATDPELAAKMERAARDRALWE